MRDAPFLYITFWSHFTNEQTS